jgi:hypothetical protein
MTDEPVSLAAVRAARDERADQACREALEGVKRLEEEIIPEMRRQRMALRAALKAGGNMSAYEQAEVQQRIADMWDVIKLSEKAVTKAQRLLERFDEEDSTAS